MTNNEKGFIYNCLKLESQEEYEALIVECKKIFFYIKNKEYNNIPNNEEILMNIISEALLLTTTTYDPTKGQNAKSYLYEKIRGEMFKWLSKKSTENKKIGELIKKDSANQQIIINENNETEHISNTSNPLEILEAEDSTRRKIAANNMAKGELPFELQVILDLAIENDNIETAAEIIYMDINEYRAKRDKALSIVLKKVARSHHLSSEEQEEVKKLYDI